MKTLLPAIVIGGLALALFAFWAYALRSVVKNERLDAPTRLLWMLVVVFLSIFGAALYLLIAPNRHTRG